MKTIPLLSASLLIAGATLAHHRPGHGEPETGAPAWTLDAAQSRLSFVSTRNDKLTEVHRFQTVSPTEPLTELASVGVAF